MVVRLTRQTLTTAIPILITLVLIGVIVYLTQYYWGPTQIAAYLAQFGPLSMVAYVGLIIIANIAAPISATPLLLLGFSLYQQQAIWLFALGNFTAMAINFWIARRFGRTFIVRLVGEQNLAKIDQISHSYGLLAVFGVRLFFSGISDIASYAFGLSPIRFKPYIIVSIIASLPPYLLLYFFSGQHLSSLEFILLQLFIAGVLSAVFLVGRYLVRRFLQLLLYGKIN